MQRSSSIIVYVLAGLVLLSVGWRTGAAAPTHPVYRLGSGDQVRITVFGQQDLSGEYEVNGAGRISLPLIQDVQASGLTANQLEKEITDKLKPDYLTDPRVNVAILKYRPFYILGEVNQPGSYPYTDGMTVLNAVALAGGYTYRARTGEVTITRANDPRHRKRTADGNTKVFPGDVIKVPERWF